MSPLDLFFYIVSIAAGLIVIAIGASIAVVAFTFIFGWVRTR